MLVQPRGFFADPIAHQVDVRNQKTGPHFRTVILLLLPDTGHVWPVVL